MLPLTGVPDGVEEYSSRWMLSPFVANEVMAELMVAIRDPVALAVVAVGEVAVLAVTITGKFVLVEAIGDAVMLGVVVVVVEVVVVVPATKQLNGCFTPVEFNINFGYVSN